MSDTILNAFAFSRGSIGGKSVSEEIGPREFKNHM